MPRPIINMAGQEYGRLAVLRPAAPHERVRTVSRDTQWRCECLCGAAVTRTRGSLLTGDRLHCGADFCQRHPWRPAPKPAGKKPPGAGRRTNYGGLAGQPFGRLTVVEDSGRRIGRGHVVWLCSCSCGGQAHATTANLRSGNTTSCGCVQQERSREANRKES